MKKTFALILCLCLVFMAAGCRKDNPETTLPSTAAPTAPAAETTQPSTVPEVTEIISFQEPLAAISLPIVSEVETASDSTVLFTYTYQSVYLTLQDPAVAEAVVVDLLNRIDSTRASAQAILATVQGDYALSNGWNPYFYQVIYNPTRIDQGVLSLYGTQVSYSGNPHPTHISMSANYDLVTGKALRFSDILAEDFSAQQLCQLICLALEPHAQELYGYYEDILTDRFSGDLSAVESWYFSDYGLCFYFSPYDIAPYSAGTIIAEVPYESLNGILRDDYFPAERGAGAGKLSAVYFADAERSGIRQYVELLLDGDGENILLLPEGTVHDIRIEIGSWVSDGSFSSEAVVFAAESLSEGDAIMIQTHLVEDAPRLRLTYHSGEETVCLFIRLNSDGQVTLAEQ